MWIAAAAMGAARGGREGGNLQARQGTEKEQLVSQHESACPAKVSSLASFLQGESKQDPSASYTSGWEVLQPPHKEWNHRPYNAFNHSSVQQQCQPASGKCTLFCLLRGRAPIDPHPAPSLGLSTTHPQAPAASQRPPPAQRPQQGAAQLPGPPVPAGRVVAGSAQSGCWPLRR